MYVYVPHMCSACGDQKRVSDSLRLPFECWELNLGPLEELPLGLTAKSNISPAPDYLFFLK